MSITEPCFVVTIGTTDMGKITGKKDTEMEQLNIFSLDSSYDHLPGDLLDYRPAVFSKDESNHYLNELIDTTPWHQKVSKMYSKQIVTPRLTAWYGDKTLHAYASLGENMPNPWTRGLLAIKQKVEQFAGIEFNGVLLNYYRDGNDSVAWHSDKVSVGGDRAVVASVTFGQPRYFDIRNKEDHRKHFSILLEHGSYLLMKGGMQESWEHRIAKSRKPMQARVNLTFRIVK